MRGDAEGERVYSEEVKSRGLIVIIRGRGRQGDGVSEYCGEYNCKRKGKQRGAV